MSKLYWFCLGVVIYASLYPFNFVVPALGDIDTAEIYSANSLGDVFVNILVFGLIGVLARLAGEGDERKTRLLLILAIAFSILGQVLQAFVPGRYPGLLDIFMNLFGLALGFLSARSVDAFVRRRFYFNLEICGPVAFLTALFVAGQLYPFFPALRVSGLKQNYWAMLSDAKAFDWVTVAQYGVYWFILLLLLRPMSGNLLLRLFMLLSPVIFFAVRLVITGNVASVWHVIGGGLGVCLFILLQRFARVSSLAIILVVAVIVFEGLMPFTPGFNHGSVSPGSIQGTLRGGVLEAFPALIWKMYLYGSLIFLLWLTRLGKGASTITVAGFMLVIEALQMLYASDVPDFVGPALALLAGLFLFRFPPLGIRLQEGRSRSV